MPRRVFFSFDYERDAWRAGQVRNSGVTKDREDLGVLDFTSWEEVKKKGRDAVENWIDDQLKGASVTVVLIGTETFRREYVRYGIAQSHKIGHGMIGIYIHNMKDGDRKTDTKGVNPFDNWTFHDSTGSVVAYPAYDWVNDDGNNKMADWISVAAKKAGK